MKKVALIFGGKSPEHQISVRSARNVMAAIDRRKYELLYIGIDPRGVWRLVDPEEMGPVVPEAGPELGIRPGQANPIYRIDTGDPLRDIDLLYLVLHGPNGEDGTIQGLVRLLGLPFIGPDVMSSSLAMDKEMTKLVLAKADIAVAPGIVVRHHQKDGLVYEEIRKRLGSPLFIKPANMGSSVGVHKVRTEAEFKRAVEDAFQYDRKILIEQMIEGREVECAVMGNDFPLASTIGEVITEEEYSYEEKYASTSAAVLQIPAKLDPKLIERLRRIALKAYRALGCEVLSRVDMFVTDSGEIYVNEINTLPGFTSISMFPQLWEQEGIPYTELIDRLIAYALERHQHCQALKTQW